MKISPFSVPFPSLHHSHFNFQKSDRYRRDLGIDKGTDMGGMTGGIEKSKCLKIRDL
jgi:hypothetical protein